MLQHATGPLFFAGPGQEIRIAPDGSRAVVFGGLHRPTGLAVGPDGALYIVTDEGDGELWRVAPRR